MKKVTLVFFIFSLILACGKKQNEPERLMEDGVEVILNRLEPYTSKGELTFLHLEEIFMIDTERENIAETGLTEIWRFDVDSEGNIYLMSYRTRDYAVFKFDQDGNYIKAFGRRGTRAW